jgi:hypothetical protein
MNWIAAFTRTSMRGWERFCQTVPSAKPSVAMKDEASPASGSPFTAESAGETTRPTPAKPIAIPPHCRAVTRSCSRGMARAAVRSGCRPVTIAVTPAGIPWNTAQKTPPR